MATLDIDLVLVGVDVVGVWLRLHCSVDQCESVCSEQIVVIEQSDELACRQA